MQQFNPLGIDATILLLARKIGPPEIVVKNPNAYHFLIPDHLCTYYVFNVAHLIRYQEYLSEDKFLNLREILSSQGRMMQHLHLAKAKSWS